MGSENQVDGAPIGRRVARKLYLSALAVATIPAAGCILFVGARVAHDSYVVSKDRQPSPTYEEWRAQLAAAPPAPTYEEIRAALARQSPSYEDLTTQWAGAGGRTSGESARCWASPCDSWGGGGLSSAALALASVLPALFIFAAGRWIAWLIR